MNEKIDIRGVSFDNVNMEEALATIEEYLGDNKQCAVFTPNSEIVQNCIDNSDFSKIINSAELIIPDGVGIISASKILKTPLKGKVAGVELGEKLLECASRKGYKVFFMGGKPSIADLAKVEMVNKYPGLQIVGTNDGYFNKIGPENDAVIEKINSTQADILYVCLGSPAQENWIYSNRDKLDNCKIFLGLGGSLDIYSKQVKRAPKFFVKLGLEWLYRLICNPSRFKRMMKLPKFYFGTIVFKHKKVKN